MRNISSVFLLCLVPFISGCGNNLVGRGYSSFAEPYKSAPGKAPSSIGYDYSASMNDRVLEDMGYAAKDLVDKLEDNLPHNISSINLLRADDSAFYSSFDHVLRDELTYRGYELVTGEDKGIKLILKAADPKTNISTLKMPRDYRNLYLAIVSVVPREKGGSKTVEKIVASGYYDVPAFGFSRNTISLPKVPETGESGKTGASGAALKEDAELETSAVIEPPADITREALDSGMLEDQYLKDQYKESVKK